MKKQYNKIEFFAYKVQSASMICISGKSDAGIIDGGDTGDSGSGFTGVDSRSGEDNIGDPNNLEW